MKRRDFILGLGSATAWPVVATGQQTDRMRRVGVLIVSFEPETRNNQQTIGFGQEFEHLGWTEGKNVHIDYRYAAGDPALFKKFASELVSQSPDVIFASSSSAVAALKSLTRTIPIVFVLVSDPIGQGFVQSLARPGGNITGFSNVEASFGGKLLSLLLRIAPNIKVAAAMYNPDTQSGAFFLDSFTTAARSLGIERILIEARSDADIDRSIASLGREQGGLVAIPDPFTNNHSRTIIEVSKREGVPVIYNSIYFAREGGLIQYGPSYAEVFRRAASYVDRILRGEKAGDLPVELPTKYTLVINLKTAKALGRAWSKRGEMIPNLAQSGNC